jgi:hypothetical protein
MLLIFLTGSLSAQNMDEYQKKQQAEMQKMQQEQTSGTNKLKKEYTDYVSKRDTEWADYLRQEWEQFEVFAGKKSPLKPKPTDMPAYTPPGEVPVPKVIPPAVKPVVVPVDVPKPEPNPENPLCKPAENASNADKITLDFYGCGLSVPYDIAMTSCRLTEVSQNALSSFWEKLSATNYTPTVEQLLKAKSELKLNDYGYFQLVQQVSINLSKTNEHEACLLSWFIMVRSGYGVRAAFKDQQIALLVPLNQQVYSHSFISVGNKKFYLFPEIKGGSLSTYDKDYSTTSQMLDLNIVHPLNFAERRTEKTFSFSFDNSAYNLKLAYNPDLINFYKKYPQVDFEVIFNAASSTQAKQSMVAALKPYTTQMDELKAVNFLLHFVQTAFQYKTDEEQFGREKWFFPEELFYYPYSDCEDRSALFAYIVSEIMGLKVIGLQYPDHLATAVAFNVTANGDYLMYKKRRYVVSDPTYIGAPAGQTMSQYKNISPRIIDVK